jgi:hypothetical protein
MMVERWKGAAICFVENVRQRRNEKCRRGEKQTHQVLIPLLYSILSIRPHGSRALYHYLPRVVPQNG